jgi:hypothetical protein
MCNAFVSHISVFKYLFFSQFNYLHPPANKMYRFDVCVASVSGEGESKKRLKSLLHLPLLATSLRIDSISPY